VVEIVAAYANKPLKEVNAVSGRGQKEKVDRVDGVDKVDRGSHYEMLTVLAKSMVFTYLPRLL